MLTLSNDLGICSPSLMTWEYAHPLLEACHSVALAPVSCRTKAVMFVRALALTHVQVPADLDLLQYHKKKSNR